VLEYVQDRWESVSQRVRKGTRGPQSKRQKVLKPVIQDLEPKSVVWARVGLGTRKVLEMLGGNRSKWAVGVDALGWLISKLRSVLMISGQSV